MSILKFKKPKKTGNIKVKLDENQRKEYERIKKIINKTDSYIELKFYETRLFNLLNNASESEKEKQKQNIETQETEKEDQDLPNFQITSSEIPVYLYIRPSLKKKYETPIKMKKIEIEKNENLIAIIKKLQEQTLEEKYKNIEKSYIVVRKVAEVNFNSVKVISDSSTKIIRSGINNSHKINRKILMSLLNNVKKNNDSTDKTNHQGGFSS